MNWFKQKKFSAKHYNDSSLVFFFIAGFTFIGMIIASIIEKEISYLLLILSPLQLVQAITYKKRAKDMAKKEDS